MEEEKTKAEDKIEGKEKERREKEKQEAKKPEEKVEEKKIEDKTVEKKDLKKIEKKVVEGTAVVRGRDLEMSTKQAVALCNFVRGKNPENAVEMLERVIAKKMAVPMKGEIPHRKNMPKGKVSGRYPIKSSRVFIKMLRNLMANAAIKGIDAENLKITLAKADKASRPFKHTRMSFGRKRFKRSHIILEANTMKEKKTKKKAAEKESMVEKK